MLPNFDRKPFSPPHPFWVFHNDAPTNAAFTLKWYCLWQRKGSWTLILVLSMYCNELCKLQFDFSVLFPISITLTVFSSLHRAPSYCCTKGFNELPFTGCFFISWMPASLNIRRNRRSCTTKQTLQMRHPTAYQLENEHILECAA